MTDVDTIAERLHHITEVTRKHILTEWHADSCIASTRVLMTVLDYFGYPSEPMPVRLAVFTRQGWDMAERGVPVAEWPNEAWSVGINGSGATNGKRWDGHLVVSLVVDDNRFMLDPSIDQVSRPQRGIILTPSIFGIEEWPAGTPLRFERPSDGLVIMYDRLVDAGSWRRSPDWSERAWLVRRVAGAAIRELKEEPSS